MFRDITKAPVADLARQKGTLACTGHLSLPSRHLTGTRVLDQIRQSEVDPMDSLQVLEIAAKGVVWIAGILFGVVGLVILIGYLIERIKRSPSVEKPTRESSLTSPLFDRNVPLDNLLARPKAPTRDEVIGIQEGALQRLTVPESTQNEKRAALLALSNTLSEPSSLEPPRQPICGLPPMALLAAVLETYMQESALRGEAESVVDTLLYGRDAELGGAPTSPKVSPAEEERNNSALLDAKWAIVAAPPQVPIRMPGLSRLRGSPAISESQSRSLAKEVSTYLVKRYSEGIDGAEDALTRFCNGNDVVDDLLEVLTCPSGPRHESAHHRQRMLGMAASHAARLNDSVRCSRVLVELIRRIELTDLGVDKLGYSIGELLDRAADPGLRDRLLQRVNNLIARGTPDTGALYCGLRFAASYGELTVVPALLHAVQGNATTRPVALDEHTAKERAKARQAWGKILEHLLATAGKRLPRAQLDAIAQLSDIIEPFLTIDEESPEGRAYTEVQLNFSHLENRDWDDPHVRLSWESLGEQASELERAAPRKQVEMRCSLDSLRNLAQELLVATAAQPTSATEKEENRQLLG